MSDYVVVPSDVVDKESYIDACHKEIDELKSLLEECRKGLNSLEFIDRFSDDERIHYRECPACLEEIDLGHTEDCKLKMILKKLEGISGND